jgi:hypothetical protein
MPVQLFRRLPEPLQHSELPNLAREIEEVMRARLQIIPQIE